MKIKCVNNYLEDSDRSVINSDMREYLVIGATFFVFGIRICSPTPYVYIFNGNHLFEVPLGFFEVVDNRVPSEWAVKIWNNGELTFWPELFYETNFLENFAERESIERELFELLRGKFEGP